MVWVAQILTMALQLVYTGITSRAIEPAGFGTFAVALTVTALGGMLATSGLANAAARRTADDGVHQGVTGVSHRRAADRRG